MSEREEVFMKMKSAVLASALVAVSAAFADGGSLYDSDVIYNTWFTDTTGGSITEENPVYLGSAIAPAQDGYAVTAVVSVVIHATVPAVPDAYDNVSPKGSICAAYDNNGDAKWYGLQKADGTYGWVELTGMATPTEASHTLVTEFDDKGVNNVRYWVDGSSSGWYTSGHANALKKVGLTGGTGSSYTKVVGLLVNAWTETGIEDVPIAISKATLVAMGVSTENTTPEAIVTALKTQENNGIAKWANYVLGIDGTNEDNKPFAAPVQNSTANTLTFKLGGVSARTGVADVKYAIETLDAPNGSYSGALTYQDATATTDITLDSSGVKYYRVKVQIDEKSNN